MRHSSIPGGREGESDNESLRAARLAAIKLYFDKNVLSNRNKKLLKSWLQKYIRCLDNYESEAAEEITSRIYELFSRYFIEAFFNGILIYQDGESFAEDMLTWYFKYLYSIEDDLDEEFATGLGNHVGSKFSESVGRNLHASVSTHVVNNKGRGIVFDVTVFKN